MDAVAEWAMRIAERVAPDEVDFAAEVGRAYASGGKARAALFPRPGAEPGGFGPATMIGDLPVVLRALADSAESLRHLLATRELGNIVAIVTLAVAARRGRDDPAHGNRMAATTRKRRGKATPRTAGKSTGKTRKSGHRTARRRKFPKAAEGPRRRRRRWIRLTAN
ncbi:hypothetical protein ACQEU6_03470 [Spirillospora sp. CA-108201]